MAAGAGRRGSLARLVLVVWILLQMEPDTTHARGTQESETCHTATGTHMPHRITQCYLPPGRRDIPALTPAEAGTRLSEPGGMQG